MHRVRSNVVETYMLVAVLADAEANQHRPPTLRPTSLCIYVLDSVSTGGAEMDFSDTASISNNTGFMCAAM
jgi:hypothetical protein